MRGRSNKPLSPRRSRPLPGPMPMAMRTERSQTGMQRASKCSAPAWHRTSARGLGPCSTCRLMPCYGTMASMGLVDQGIDFWGGSLCMLGFCNVLAVFRRQACSTHFAWQKKQRRTSLSITPAGCGYQPAVGACETPCVGLAHRRVTAHCMVSTRDMPTVTRAQHTTSTCKSMDTLPPSRSIYMLSWSLRPI